MKDFDFEKEFRKNATKEINKSVAGATNIIITPLLIVFVVLKLVDVIDWSWWWVLSPVWIGFIVNVVVSFIFRKIFFWKLKHK